MTVEKLIETDLQNIFSDGKRILYDENADWKPTIVPSLAGEGQGEEI
jgi:hypothetical protein